MYKLIALLFLAITASAQSSIPALIPAPQTLEPGTGRFAITAQTRLAILTPVADIRRMVTDNLPGIPTSDVPKLTKAITVRLAPIAGVGPEGYDLTITPTGITLTAPEAAGLFYGLQTMRQLMPVAKTFRGQSIPALHIRDQPRFGWRGLMLDVSRHFFDKAFVKRYIDQMAQYKFNVFHWHLTDDQGWRIQINSLLKLTEAGAWRVPRTGSWGTIENPQPGEVPSYGGFYTQDDIREIVQYAQDRHITIVPEIDMPGHMMSAIAAYPGLTCGKKQVLVPTNGKFYKLEDNTLNPCTYGTYLFIDKVLTEVAQLFPGPYIHIGGDEAYKGFWTTCEECKATMTVNNLKTVEELQSYFIKRVEKIVQSKGKKLIGWDEILEGGITPDATVMSWRGMKGGIEAAKQGHPVIMTPSQFCYLDLYQGEPSAEPSTYSMARLSTSYSFDPVPDSVRADLILGGQGNLWTESVPNSRHAEYMTWPRAFAIAEVLWSPKSKRSWPDFIGRMEAHFKRFDAQDVNYARSVYNPIVTLKKNSTGITQVVLSHELPDTYLYYSTDNTVPDTHFPLYTQPFLLPKGAERVKVIAYRNGKPIGKMVEVMLPTVAKAVQ
ncbi:beta-N-acetylhexosaminidase [Spirosoma pollinicola]|uniref:beta-N-acetylhexosaminidase n=1 Tax=Spirosoma pollinicola TaxID=2057025 RepID=A0A2K8Z356_9BACT|nr:family 20 glycosylhydrolase [Spirosoma pollinicola]AUD04302.1 beta-N-acetylhexosaminidase [Spirosoma pollinicola]